MKSDSCYKVTSIPRRRLCSNISMIPDEILVEHIFVRLPARSVLDVRFVCKSWYSLTSNPSFILRHARLAPKNMIVEHPVRHHCRNYVVCSINLSQHGERITVAKRSLPSSMMENAHGHCKIQLLASCDGLLCFSFKGERDSNYVVCNPVTKDWLKVPWNIGSEFIAFYLHSSTGEYRLIQERCERYLHRRGGGSRSVKGILGYEVFSLGGSIWRRIGDSTNISMRSHWGQVQISVHGHIHWLPLSKDRWIVAFDTNSEKLRKFSMSQIRPRQGYQYGLIEIGGSLGLWEVSQIDMDLWRLKDYAKEEWIKQYTVSLDNIRTSLSDTIGCRRGYTPWVIWSDGKELLLRFGVDIVLYDLESETSKKQKICGLKQVFYLWVPHIESLISCKFLKERQRRYLAN